jgi:hypothetical protein
VTLLIQRAGWVYLYMFSTITSSGPSVLRSVQKTPWYGVGSSLLVLCHVPEMYGTSKTLFRHLSVLVMRLGSLSVISYGCPLGGRAIRSIMLRHGISSSGIGTSMPLSTFGATTLYQFRRATTPMDFDRREQWAGGNGMQLIGGGAANEV